MEIDMTEVSDQTAFILKNSVIGCFREVSDPRIKHKLVDIFFMALCAILCGADDVMEIATYVESKADWFTKILSLEHGIPSYQTLWLVFAMIDPLQFREGFTNWVNTLSTTTGGRVLAYDGKALRGTAEKGRPRSFVTMVSLWACDLGLTLGQVKVEGKSNEITAIPKLLEMVDIKGRAF